MRAILTPFALECVSAAHSQPVPSVHRRAFLRKEEEEEVVVVVSTWFELLELRPWRILFCPSGGIGRLNPKN